MKKVVIHPTAIVSETVELGEGCSVGAYSILEGNIKLGKNCIVESHVVLKGRLEAGEGIIFINLEVSERHHRIFPTKVKIQRL